MKFFLFLALFIVLTFGGGKKSTKGGKVSSGKSKGGASSNKKSSESSKSKGSGGGGGGGSSSYVPTDYIPSNDELCGCFELDLVCTPTVINDEICYYYLMTKISDDDYCQVIITDLTLGTDNNCGLTSTDIDSYLLDYAPKCYNIDPLSVDGGINIKLDPIPSGSYGSDSSSKSSTKSGTKSGGSSSSKSGTKSGTKSGGGGSSSSKTNTKTSTKTGSQSGSKKGGASSGYGSSNKSGGSSSGGTGSKSSSSGGGGSGGSSGPSISQDDYIIFSMCFDASQVAGFQSIGQVGYNTGSGSYTCDVYNVLPNFCGTPEPTSASPTSAAPTTSSPTSGSPTTADPTSASPTTASPTSASPTTSSPTTAEPTTAEPTTAEPTTAEPTTAEPTTAEPTTSDPTTADPTTASPTTSAPTTSAPTTSAPTTSEPTARPTTLVPSMAPSYQQCMTNDTFNIAFLLDESGSVDSNEWDILKNFVKRVVEFDVSPESYVALYEFAGLNGFRYLLNFTQNDPSGQQEIFDNLDDNVYSVAGQTETWDAVNRVLDDIAEYQSRETTTTTMTSPAETIIGGNECNNDPTDECWRRENILFVLTDGNPTDIAGNRGTGNDLYKTCGPLDVDGNPEAGSLEQRLSQTTNVDVVLILIDAGDGPAIDPELVNCLDVNNDQDDVIQLTSFDSAAFTDIEIRIREKICANLGKPCVTCGEDEGLPISECGSCGLSQWDPWVYPDGSIGLGPVPEGDGGGAGCSNDAGSANPCTIARPDTDVVDTGSSVNIKVLENDDDLDGNGVLSVVSVTQPTNGQAVIQGNEIVYTPNTDWCGEETFTYTISDGNDHESTADVTVTTECP